MADKVGTAAPIAAAGTPAPDQVPVPVNPEPPKPTEPAKPEAPISELFTLDRAQAKDQQIQDIINRQVAFVVQKTQLAARYNVLVLYDDGSVDRSDADRIYEALAKADADKPILLVLRSPGGDIAAAYFIGKLCREYTKTRFEIAVPREAKSAATLICCAADTIHMGSLSELGPIDPQFGGMPALAVKHSVEHLAQLVTQYPGAREMLSDYLSKSLAIEVLGHYERAAGSAVQYAERLLAARVGVKSPPERNAEIARRLVYEYKDHGFAIDSREAATIFGEDVIRTNSEEYRGANDIYEALDILKFLLERMFRREFAFTGDHKSGCWLYAKKRK